MKTRDEHLEWCKQRALMELTDNTQGRITSAWSSMVTDLAAHPETKDHSAIDLGYNLITIGSLSTKAEMEKFITDFN